MTAVSAHGVSVGSELGSQARFADRVMFLSLLGQTVAALAIGSYFNDLGVALFWSAALLAVGGGAFAAGRGQLLARIVLPLCNAGFVMLQIQLGRGLTEFHFGVFVLLGLLLVYRDWRPLVLTAAAFALHHVLFDRLQALHYGLYCTPEANFPKMLLHAGYVIAQTGVEIFLAVGLRRSAIEAAEILALVSSVDHGGTLSLDVRQAPVSTPTSTRVKAIISRMGTALAAVGDAASTMQKSASDISGGVSDLSARTESQASSLEQTSASMEELTSTVKNNADLASQANEIAGHASRAATRGGELVSDVVATMQGISASSGRIGEITGVIDGIAFQTNLLALNAAVEAARAGEQGRGFAVVASEVRSLAQRCAAAAKEIKELIGESVTRVEKGAGLVAEARTQMLDIVVQVERVNALIAEISHATREQSAGIGQVCTAVTQLDGVTQQNAALVEESAAAIENIRLLAARLTDLVGVFELGSESQNPRDTRSGITLQVRGGTRARGQSDSRAGERLTHAA